MGLALALAVPAARAEGQGMEQPTITVRGEGMHRAAPDAATLTVSITTQGPDMAAAMGAHADRVARGEAALKALGPDGLVIEESNFSVYEQTVQPDPVNDPARSEQRVVAVTSYTLAIEAIAPVNALVSRIAAAELFGINAVTYRVKDERGALNEARKAAVIDARDQARAYADAAGVTLGALMSIADGAANRPNARMDFAAAPMKEASVGIIPPSTLTFTASVEMRWRMTTP